MPSPPLRDSLTFPWAAARWGAAGSIIASVLNAGITVSRFVGDRSMPHVLRDILPGLLAQAVLSAVLVAVVVLVVASRRQARSPGRVGQARNAAAATGLVAALGTWAAVSLVSTLAYSQVPALQSPLGFAMIGTAVSLLHVGAAAVGASVGAALLPEVGEPAPPASPSRDAAAAVLVFGGVIAFGTDLALSALPGLLHEAMGSGLFAMAQWSPLLALTVGIFMALGYAWRRHAAPDALPWSGDAWTALAALPIAFVLGAVFAVLVGGIAYLLGDQLVPAALVAGVVVLLMAGFAFGGLGAVAGLLRTRGAGRRD